jgi:hypothetical protein
VAIPTSSTTDTNNPVGGSIPIEFGSSTADASSATAATTTLLFGLLVVAPLANVLWL